MCHETIIACILLSKDENETVGICDILKSQITEANMKKINLAQDWYVYRRDDAFSLVTSIPADAVHTDLPYDAMFHDEQKADSLNQGRTGYFDGGVYYYQKNLVIGKEYEGCRLILKAEGLFTKSFVYVNGSLAASGDFGYISTVCDITGYVHPGDNTLLIICKTDPYSSRWYCGAGILRPVYLYAAEKVYTMPDSFHVNCEYINESGAMLRVKADLANDMPAASVEDVTFTVKDGQKVVLEETFPLRINHETHLDRRFFLKGAELYSEDHPHLYTMVLKVKEDETSIRTGIRHETFDAANGVCINGKQVKLRGACIHHDEGILGGIALKEFEYYRVSRLKEAGFNAIRSAHNHPSQELLEVCDELGVWVLDEICDMWTKMKGFGDYAQYFQHDWKNAVDLMMKEDRNHPCVIGYSTGNEISDINTEKGFETAHDLYERIHELDDTRFVTNGINGAFAAGEELIDIAVDLSGMDRSVFESGDVNRFMGLMATRMSDIVTHPVVSKVVKRMDSCVDVQGYNYMTARYARDAQEYPNRIMLGTETYPKQIAENWRNITKLNAVIGDFTWTGWDYMGELSEPYPALNNTSGDLDRFGFRRPVSYYREIVYGLRKDPYICVRPPKAFGTPREFGPWKFTDAVENWLWDCEEGQMVSVEVYSPDEKAQLFLNGESMGVKELHECYALFNIPYQKGELKAVCSSGREFILKTADPQSATIVTEDFVCNDYVFSRISLKDKDGNTVIADGQEVCCGREGMELLAAASEKTVHHNGFVNSSIRLYGQGGLAVYRKA